MTQCWYGKGRGNISRLYAALYDCDKASGLVAYDEKIWLLTTQLTFIVEKELTKTIEDKEKAEHESTYDFNDILSSGYSPIARLMPCTVATPAEHRVLKPLD